MIDLHCHVLPGIDDGPAHLESAVAMVHAYEADGVTTIVATPHLRSDFPRVVPGEIAVRCQGLEATATADGAEVQIVPGGEVALGWALDASDADLEAASLGGLGRDVLIETPHNPTSAGIGQALFTIALRGYRITSRTLSSPLLPARAAPPGRSRPGRDPPAGHGRRAAAPGAPLALGGTRSAARARRPLRRDRLRRPLARPLAPAAAQPRGRRGGLSRRPRPRRVAGARRAGSDPRRRAAPAAAVGAADAPRARLAARRAGV